MEPVGVGMVVLLKHCYLQVPFLSQQEGFPSLRAESGAAAVCIPCFTLSPRLSFSHSFRPLPRHSPQFSKHQKQHMVTYLFLIQMYMTHILTVSPPPPHR